MNHVVWSRFHFGMLCTGGIWPCGVVLLEALVGCVAVGCDYPTRGSSRVKRGRVMVLKTDELCCDGKLRYGAVMWSEAECRSVLVQLIRISLRFGIFPSRLVMWRSCAANLGDALLRFYAVWFYNALARDCKLMSSCVSVKLGNVVSSSLLCWLGQVL